MKPWEVRRAGFRWVVARLVFADFAGSGYKYARDCSGYIARYWRKSSAQALADALNQMGAK